MMKGRDFPEDFLWGAATSAYQIEGGYEDGKGPSVWDEFEKRPDAMRDNAEGSVASDHYHRWREDVAMMKGMGLRAYRFSVSWSRIFPDGYGRVNQKGLDFYKALCDELLSADIIPYVTLYHWDLPLKLQQEFGGWESRETGKHFADYAAAFASSLGDRVKNYFTFNEFLACADVAYGMGLIAPGLKLPPKRLNQVRHHLLVAHGLGVQALRAAAPQARIGVADNPSFMMPVRELPEHIEAAKQAFRDENGRFLTAIMEGAYPAAYLEKEGADAPVFSDQDMRIIHEPLDLLGLNLYFGKYVSADAASPRGYRIFEEDPEKKQSGIADFYNQPSSMYWGCRLVDELWHPRDIVISENGTLQDDRPAADGQVYDLERITFLRNQLVFLARAVQEGCPVSGYLHWSLMDNLEWHHGFRPRFGLWHVNYRTLERTPKLSAAWYADLIRTGRIG